VKKKGSRALGVIGGQGGGRAQARMVKMRIEIRYDVCILWSLRRKKVRSMTRSA